MPIISKEMKHYPADRTIVITGKIHRLGTVQRAKIAGSIKLSKNDSRTITGAQVEGRKEIYQSDPSGKGDTKHNVTIHIVYGPRSSKAESESIGDAESPKGEGEVITGAIITITITNQPTTMPEETLNLGDPNILPPTAGSPSPLPAPGGTIENLITT